MNAVGLHRGLLNTEDHDLVILIDGDHKGNPVRYRLATCTASRRCRRSTTCSDLGDLLALHKTARTELLTEAG